MFKALKAAASLSTEAVEMFTNTLIEGHIGQGLDLFWTFQTEVPTEEEYFAMVDGSKKPQTSISDAANFRLPETGGIFVLLAQLMRSEATAHKDINLAPLMLLFGRFFQARDDYQNLASKEVGARRRTTCFTNGSLTSTQYAEQKGVADDINEGKMSLPLIQALSTKSLGRGRLSSILQMRKSSVPLSKEVLKMAVKEIRAGGGLDYARNTAKDLQEKVNSALSYFETKTGARNYILRLVQKKLELDK